MITHFFHLPMLSFIFVNKQIKTPPKKQKTKYQRDVHKFKGEKIIFPNREKDRWKRKKIYLRVLRLRSWFVSMRSLNPWWTMRRSRECGDEAAAATARVWIVKGLEWSWDLRLEIGSRENKDFWDWEWDFDLILRSENRSEMGLNSSKTEACVWILWNSV